jgi:hypothetical protein
MCGAVILPAATVVGRRKNTQIYIINGPKRCAAGSAIAKIWSLGKNIPPGPENIKIFHENVI